MRRLVFILMIALLPLRGWMGEAMATEMATIHLIATQAIKTPAIAIFDTENGMPADCEMHAKAVPTSPSSTSSKQACTHCQACHAAGLVCTVQIISSTATHNPTPSAHVSLFASAQLALGQKPPIL